MLVRESSFTVDLGENGYLIGFTDDYEYPPGRPFGWCCGPATDANAVVLTTTDTGPLEMSIQVHDAPSAPETSGGWEPVEEISLRADTPLHSNFECVFPFLQSGLSLLLMRTVDR
ncbi:hypothetical protein ACQEVG_18170 [Streptomyces sp. CA-135486]|uniref:hypothetical protein n=1 Tax=Streptomyces sp. CA-135486 TaxID=3240049 RepID=UPI003D8A5E9B